MYNLPYICYDKLYQILGVVELKLLSGTVVKCELLNFQGIVQGYSIQSGRYAVQDRNGYMWYVDETVGLEVIPYYV